MPLRIRRGTEEDLAKLPTLLIAFGPKKPRPEDKHAGRAAGRRRRVDEARPDEAALLFCQMQHMHR
jgi:hypothetical protein